MSYGICVASRIRKCIGLSVVNYSEPILCYKEIYIHIYCMQSYFGPMLMVSFLHEFELHLDTVRNCFHEKESDENND